MCLNKLKANILNITSYLEYMYLIKIIILYYVSFRLIGTNIKKNILILNNMINI